MALLPAGSARMLLVLSYAVLPAVYRCSGTRPDNTKPTKVGFVLFQ